MFGFGVTQLLIVLVVVPALAYMLGKALGALLNDNQRRIVGEATVMLISAGVAIYGIVSLNSTRSRVSSVAFDSYDTLGIACIVAGVFVAIVGFVALLSRQSVARAAAAATRKCPYCAESIQPEAQLFRFCGSALDERVHAC